MFRKIINQGEWRGARGGRIRKSEERGGGVKRRRGTDIFFHICQRPFVNQPELLLSSQYAFILFLLFFIIFIYISCIYSSFFSFFFILPLFFSAIRNVSADHITTNLHHNGRIYVCISLLSLSLSLCLSLIGHRGGDFIQIRANCRQRRYMWFYLLRCVFVTRSLVFLSLSLSRSISYYFTIPYQKQGK